MPNPYTVVQGPMQGLKNYGPPTPQWEPGPTGPSDPQESMELARYKMQGEMPAESAGVSGVGPMSFFDRMKVPSNATAFTTPGNRIGYNPSLLSADQAENDNTMAHELTHVGQNQRAGGHWYDAFMGAPQENNLSYRERPREMEAFATEERRRKAHEDVNLPVEGLRNAR